jgi:hypothetical protein
MSSSIATALKPAGLENAAGVITAAFLKDANDLAKDEQATNWQAFLTNTVGLEAKTTAPPSSAMRPRRHWSKCSNGAAMTYLVRTL